MKFSRAWAMPSPDTFSIQPIACFVARHITGVSVDPFARNSRLAAWTNDINPETAAEYHMQAVDFLKMLLEQKVKADTVLFDPPYSPRQISECYRSIGKTASMTDTQSSVMYKEVRAAIRDICRPGAVVLQFGWNSCGMGEGWEMEEILLVSHGGAHNDTICTASRLINPRLI